MSFETISHSFSLSLPLGLSGTGSEVNKSIKSIILIIKMYDIWWNVRCMMKWMYAWCMIECKIYDGMYDINVWCMMKYMYVWCMIECKMYDGIYDVW